MDSRMRNEYDKKLEALKTELKLNTEQLSAMADFVEKVTKAASDFGFIVRVTHTHAFVSLRGGVIACAIPPFTTHIGQGVLLDQKTKQILKAIDVPRLGADYLVKGIDVENEEVTIEHGMRGDRRVACDFDRHDVSVGDRVWLDGNSLCVTHTEEATLHKHARTDSFTPTPWDAIGGLEEAKRVLREAVELPFQHPLLFAHYKMKPPKGVLLKGPPGCGKTMLGRALATSIGKADDADAFIYVKGPEILAPLVGVAEANIRELFLRARNFHTRTHKPAVIFIDEAEAILSKRGSGRSSDIDKTIVPQFLTEMDGLETSAAIVVLATNRPELLDPAVVREGRIDRQCAVTRPSVTDAEAILARALEPLPIKGETKRMATGAAGYLYSDQLLIAPKVPLYRFVSGAMIVNIVERAASRALHRDLEAGTRSCITDEDLIEAMHVIAQAREHTGEE